MGTIVGKEGGNIESWVYPRGDGANIGRGVDKGGIKPAAGKNSKKLKSLARQEDFFSEKNRHAPNPTGEMDGI
jgi:flavin-dependent dehydrogenase